ncbi:MAG: molybdopterin-dependent oxidoreductase, partial [Clostridia bacterium]
MATLVHGACPHDCYDTCGLLLEVEDGRITKIGPDPLQPLTRNFLCLKVNRYLERLYHPDRVLHPLKRVGRKGSGAFERITWDEALSDIGAHLSTVLGEFGGEAVLPYSFAGNMGILAGESLDLRFFHAIGASRLDRTICTAASGAALDWVYGSRLGPDPETIPASRMILLWGTNPVATNVHEVPLLEEARANGAEVWTIDPIRTETARRYAPHLKPHPGTDLALALGIGRELLRRGVVDHDLVQRLSRGFDEYAACVEPWPLARTASETGIPVPELEALIERLGTVRPLLFRTGYGVQRQRLAARTVWAISALSILTGSLRDVGGGHLLTNASAFVLNSRGLSRPDLMPHPTRLINMVELG